MPTIKYPKNPNVDTAFVEQEDGTQNRALMVAPQDISTLELPNNPNSTKGYVTIDGNKQRVVLTAQIAGEGGSSLPDQTGHSGEFLTTDGTDASWAAVDALPSQTGQSGKFLTTDGTDASWSDKPLTNTATGYNSLTIGGNAAYNGRSTNVGINSTASSGSSTAFGNSANCSGPYAIAIGASPVASKDYTIAIGNNARAEQIGSIQLGKGTNNETSTFYVGLVSDNVGTTVNYKLLDANGTIPTDRFTTTPSADGTYVPTLTISSGTPTRSWAAPSGGLPSQTGNSGKFLTTDGTDASWAAISALQNTATGTNSLTILSSNATAAQDAVNIGYGSRANGYRSTSVGTYCGAGQDSIAMGYSADGRNATYSVLLGDYTYAYSTNFSVVIGYKSYISDSPATTGAVVIGCSSAYNRDGARADNSTNGIVIGTEARITNATYSISIGAESKSTAAYNIQLGKGTNSTVGTFSVGLSTNGSTWNNYELLSADGTIPTARLTKANTTVTLAVADWSSSTQTVSVTGVTATSIVFVAPDSASQSDYTSAGILCTAQGAGTLTFTCSTTPTNAITVNVVAL